MLRQRLRDAVASVLEGRPDCLAAYEGGSAAFGRADAMSDVDVEVLVEDGAVEAVAAAALAAAGEVAPVARVWRRPELNINGAHQWFAGFADETRKGRTWQSDPLRNDP